MVKELWRTNATREQGFRLWGGETNLVGMTEQLKDSKIFTVHRGESSQRNQSSTLRCCPRQQLRSRHRQAYPGLWWLKPAWEPGRFCKTHSFSYTQIYTTSSGGLWTSRACFGTLLWASPKNNTNRPFCLTTTMLWLGLDYDYLNSGLSTLFAYLQAQTTSTWYEVRKPWHLNQNCLWFYKVDTAGRKDQKPNVGRRLGCTTNYIVLVGAGS